jgi:hypothetical protein
MGVCVLSVEETALLEKFATLPVCKNHRHVTRLQADMMLSLDSHRVVGGKDTKVESMNITRMITPVAIRQWGPTPCSPGNDFPSAGMRCWGNSPTK